MSASPLLMGTLLGIGALWLVTIIAADLSMARAKLTPGMPVTSGPETFVFRAVRAHANLVENLSPFVLALVTARLAELDATWTGFLVGGFLAARILHATAYYANLARPRTVGFILGLVFIGSLFASAAYTALL